MTNNTIPDEHRNPKLPNAIFICTGNSCRSQIAEGWAKHHLSGLVNVYSAGVMATKVHPYSMAVMAEVGIDISNQASNDFSQVDFSQIHYVMVLCPYADTKLPDLGPHTKRIALFVEDPINATGKPEKVLDVYRNCREEIEHIVLNLKKGLFTLAK